MATIGVLTGEAARVDVRHGVGAYALLALSCVVGVGISYLGWKARLPRLGHLLHGARRRKQDAHGARERAAMGPPRHAARHPRAPRMPPRRSHVPAGAAARGDRSSRAVATQAQGERGRSRCSQTDVELRGRRRPAMRRPAADGSGIARRVGHGWRGGGGAAAACVASRRPRQLLGVA
eukprot:4947938-Prymnesium_polylepis.1